MKKIFSIVVGLTLAAIPAVAQWAVFDVANLTQNITNYAAMVAFYFA